ncbi:unnamed protein product [Lupinus luteus]|uniref:Uncharacterized protein n=1 Tax=Lupinus luteus TaxID=3873 RepID=A0AAV1Y6X1_LUPLU
MAERHVEASNHRIIVHFQVEEEEDNCFKCLLQFQVSFDPTYFNLILSAARFFFKGSLTLLSSTIQIQEPFISFYTAATWWKICILSKIYSPISIKIMMHYFLIHLLFSNRTTRT